MSACLYGSALNQQVNQLLRLAFFTCMACLMPHAFAALPLTINYQGYLTTPGGAPVSNAVTMTFRIYNAANGGASLYAETQPAVNVANGNFNAIIGAVTPITLPFDIPYWMSVAINADQEMSPRQPLASSAYAFRAASLESTATISGSQVSGTIANASLPATSLLGTINSAQIADNAVTQAKLSPVSGAAAGKVLGTDGSNLQWQHANVGTITGVNAGSGLTGGGSSGGVALAVDTSSVQARVTGSCVAGSFISQVNGNGTVVCQADTGGTGNITGNLTMFDSSATLGNILKGGVRFLHNYGSENAFVGEAAGNFTMTGNRNIAFGRQALIAVTSGRGNAALGPYSLPVNTTGNFNTAIGNSALQSNVSGSSNIAIGDFAGALATGSNNILIGSSGAAAESGVMRIGTESLQTKTYIAGINSAAIGATMIPVFINSGSQLGTISSSRRYKDDIADMNTASSALMNLRPVTFHYKTDQNSAGRTRQYGLIAEEVNEIYPGLVAHSADGQIETVMYQHLPPMLLNEFQKQQRRINALERELLEVKALLLAR